MKLNRLPLPLGESYERTRLGATEQRTVNLYPHSQGGWRQFPGLVSFASVTATAPTINDSQSTFSIGQVGLVFRDNGTKAFGINPGFGSEDDVLEVTLSTPWDITSAGSVTSTELDHLGASAASQDLAISSDGTKLYVSDNDGKIYQFGMTAWDSSTATTASISLDTSSNMSNLRGFCFNSDGTSLYATNSQSPISTVYQYDLSTGWDLSTAAYSGFSKTLSHAATHVHVNNSDNKLYTAALGPTMYQYSIADKVDISSAALTTTFTASEFGTLEQCRGIAWGDSGNKLYLNNSADFLIYEYDASSAYLFGGSSRVARGMEVMNGVLYAVFDQTLYSIDINGATSSIGTIEGIDRCVMETDGVQLVITTGTSGNTIYVYTTAGGLVTVTDADIEDDALSSAYMDLKFYFDQDGGQFIGSTNNDATVFSTDDKAEAESFADSVLRMFAHNQLLYAFGQTSTEPWYASGVGRPPVDRQQVIERGVIGTHAVDDIDDIIFFVDQFGRANMMEGLQYVPIYTPGVAEEWSTYANIKDCIVAAYSYNKMSFVDFVFPSQGTSWTYHVNSKKWVEREDASSGRYPPIAYANVYNKTLALANSMIYELSETTYQDDGSDITRIKDIYCSAEIYGEPSIFGNELVCNSLKLTFESTAASQTVTVSLSKDGGAFGQSRTITLGSGVETREINAWGRFREGVFRVTMTANAGIDLVAASADMESVDA